MYKAIFYLVIGLLLFSAGCVAIDESDIEGAHLDETFGPASLAGMWKGESNWDGTTKEIKVWVRKPTIERMITPTPQAPIKKTESVPSKRDESHLSKPTLTLNQNSKSIPTGLPSVKGQDGQSPIPQAPASAWEQIRDTGLVFWGWDISIKFSEKEFLNIQIILKEEGNGKLTVVSQTGGTGNARFVQEGEEKRIEVALAHPIFKEIKGRILYDGDKINGSFTLFGKEGLLKLEKDNSKPVEK